MNNKPVNLHVNTMNNNIPNMNNIPNKQMNNMNNKPVNLHVNTMNKLKEHFNLPNPTPTPSSSTKPRHYREPIDKMQYFLSFTLASIIFIIILVLFIKVFIKK